MRKILLKKMGGQFNTGMDQRGTLKSTFLQFLDTELLCGLV